MATYSPVKTFASKTLGTSSRVAGALGPKPLSGAAAMQMLNPPAPLFKPLAAGPDVVARTVAGGQNTFTRPAGAQPAAPAAAAAQGPPAGGPDYTGDPVYQQIVALSNRQRGDAESQALAQRKQELIGYGYDPTLDQSGAGAQLFPDQSTREAAQGNPFSTVAGLQKGYTGNLNSIADALNQRNLFYSSSRANAEANAGQDYQQALAEAAAARDRNLGGIAEALAGARQGADTQDIGAANDAYGRALAFALANQTGGAGIGGALAGTPGPGPYEPGGTPPATYASMGAVPQPITADMVAPPQTSPGFPAFTPAPAPSGLASGGIDAIAAALAAAAKPRLMAR